MSRKRFQFSLEKVLHLREHETRRAEQVFTDAITRQREKEEELQNLQQRLAEAGLLRPTSGTVRSATLQKVEARREVVEKQIRRAEGQLASLARNSEKARQRLTEKKTDQESLETLRDKQLARHRAAAKSEETAQSDEQAIAAFNRK
jgi:flagellar export protein FliJ